MAPGLSKHQSIFWLSSSHTRHLSQQPSSSTEQPWLSFQSGSGTSKETTAHFSIFYGPGVHGSPTLFLSDKTALHDNTEFSTESETATQTQQGSCTVYTAFCILLQSHLYLITTRTKSYICSQYLYFPFGSSDNISHRVELKLTWQAGFISISFAKPFQLESHHIVNNFKKQASTCIMWQTHNEQTRKYKRGWGELKQINI